LISYHCNLKAQNLIVIAGDRAVKTCEGRWLVSAGAGGQQVNRECKGGHRELGKTALPLQHRLSVLLMFLINTTEALKGYKTIALVILLYLVLYNGWSGNKLVELIARA